ncbi:V-set and immunoglobulin domain-containing protein 1 isoform X3 [Caretta caretta]|uniref:V-set and immunoglobulin domain-containing protein 1 isoform X3 n=1 Tax=Caretta caretta TaxID=8467 RepID=UPI003F4BB3C2
MTNEETRYFQKLGGGRGTKGLGLSVCCSCQRQNRNGVLELLHSLCRKIQNMDEKSVNHCQKTVYVTDARGRCSWKHQIYYFQNGQAYEYGEFKNRINGTTNQGNASITISNMQPSDTGFYTCEVFNPQDSNGRNQKSVAVSVLVKPSQPHCSLRGTPETGHLVSLSCYSEEGMPAPTYQWYRVSGETLKPMTEQLNTKTGLFIIGNLTTFETGYYRCTASNSLGNSSCEVDLSAAHQCLRNNRQMSNMLIYPPKKMSLLPQLHQAEKLMQPMNTLLLRKLLPLECLKMMRCKEWRHKQEPKNSTAISLSAMDPIFKNVGIELTQEGVWYTSAFVVLITRQEFEGHAFNHPRSTHILASFFNFVIALINYLAMTVYQI